MSILVKFVMDILSESSSNDVAIHAGFEPVLPGQRWEKAYDCSQVRKKTLWLRKRLRALSLTRAAWSE